MRMKFDFWRKAENVGTALLAGPASLSTSVDSLKDAFRTAAFGQDFRTQTYGSTALPDCTEWLGAHFSSLPNKGWVVLRKTRNAAHYSAGDVVDQKEAAHGLTFFDAIEYLARYEASQTARGFVPVIENQVEALGFQHFMAFGRREGLAFDVDGMPHPTDHGRIVTSGVFPEKSYNEVQAATEKKMASFRSSPVALLDPAQFREKLKDMEGHMHALTLLEAALNTMDAAVFAGKDTDNTAWFMSILNQKLENKINASWLSTAASLQQFLKDRSDTLVPPGIELLMSRVRYEFLVFNAANIMLQQKRSGFDGNHAEFYSKASLESWYRRAVKSLLSLGFAGDVEQQVFRDVHLCCHELITLESKATVYTHVKNAVSFLKGRVKGVKQELGIAFDDNTLQAQPTPPQP